MIQGIIILVIVVALLGTGFTTGKKWEKSVWQPVYNTLATQMKTMQHELNLKAETAKGKANVLGAEITVIGEVSKVESESMQKEVDRRVERYLDKLLIAGLQPVPKEGNSSNEGSTASPMSASARASFERGGKDGLFRDLDELERAALKEIIKKGMIHQTEAIKRQIYLKEQESKMKTQRNR